MIAVSADSMRPSALATTKATAVIALILPSKGCGGIAAGICGESAFEMCSMNMSLGFRRTVVWPSFPTGKHDEVTVRGESLIRNGADERSISQPSISRDI